MRLSRSVRKTITATLLLFVPIICAAVLVWGLAEITPDWSFDSRCISHVDEQICYKCREYHR